ncbi:M15 family metallopeptidase [Paenibacillus sp. FSL H8-0537]|uniref:M15 family metallopeptidase n=1 Tax=Paenibacillus sp. FSL H8-0537 TaxID=2921399 RepID=UPI003100E013
MLTLLQVKNKSIPKLAGLLAPVRAASERLIERCYARDIPIVITQGLRTIAEQDKLYAQGRTTAGSIVTNARGGYSYHNFGVAIDFALLSPDGKQAYWDTKRDGNVNQTVDWAEVVDEAKRLGFAWGGDWTSFKDYPHFEMTFGLSTAQLRAGIRPTTAQITAAMAIITKEDSYTMKAEDANALIKRYLQPAWAACKQKGDTAGMQEAHRLANELRKASGQKEQ